MSDLNLKPYDPLYPMRIHPYEELLKDQNASVLDKINSIIDYLNSVGKLTNDVVKNWNTVYNWTMNDGLKTGINNKLEDMLAKGEFDTIINTVVTKIGDITTLTTTDKTNLTKAINELVSKIGDLTTLTTPQKDTIVHSINSLQSEVTTNTNNIGTNTANIATNTSNIASNASQLASMAKQDELPAVDIITKYNIQDTDTVTIVTQKIQQAINDAVAGNKRLRLRKSVMINNTLFIPYIQFMELLGDGKDISITMTVNNIPIIQTTKLNTHSCVIKDISLMYQNQQVQTDTNSFAMGFLTESDNDGSGIYHWLIKNVLIDKAYTGIGIMGNGTRAVWGCTFEDIRMSNIAYDGIQLNKGTIGQPQNVIRNFVCLNDNAPTPQNNAISMNAGTTIIENLDLEGWTCQDLIWIRNGNSKIKNIYTERHHFYNTSTSGTSSLLRLDGNESVFDVDGVLLDTDSYVALEKNYIILSVGQTDVNLSNVAVSSQSVRPSSGFYMFGGAHIDSKFYINNCEVAIGKITEAQYLSYEFAYRSIIESNSKPYQITNPEWFTANGQWKKGMKFEFVDPTAQGALGIICTVGGSGAPDRINSTAYTVGNLVNANGNVYECTTAGTTGTTAPSGTGTGISDGTVVWRYYDIFTVWKKYGALI